MVTPIHLMVRKKLRIQDQTFVVEKRLTGPRKAVALGHCMTECQKDAATETFTTWNMKIVVEEKSLMTPELKVAATTNMFLTLVKSF